MQPQLLSSERQPSNFYPNSRSTADQGTESGDWSSDSSPPVLTTTPGNGTKRHNHHHRGTDASTRLMGKQRACASQQQFNEQQLSEISIDRVTRSNQHRRDSQSQHLQPTRRRRTRQRRKQRTPSSVVSSAGSRHQQPTSIDRTMRKTPSSRSAFVVKSKHATSAVQPNHQIQSRHNSSRIGQFSRRYSPPPPSIAQQTMVLTATTPSPLPLSLGPPRVQSGQNAALSEMAKLNVLLGLENYEFSSLTCQNEVKEFPRGSGSHPHQTANEFCERSPTQPMAATTLTTNSRLTRFQLRCIHAIADMIMCPHTVLPICIGVFARPGATPKEAYTHRLFAYLKSMQKRYEKNRDDRSSFDIISAFLPPTLACLLSYLLSLTFGWQLGLTVGLTSIFLYILFLGIVIFGGFAKRWKKALEIGDALSRYSRSWRLLFDILFYRVSQETITPQNVRMLPITLKLSASQTAWDAAVLLSEKMWTAGESKYSKLAMYFQWAGRDILTSTRRQSRRSCCLPLWFWTSLFLLASLTFATVLRIHGVYILGLPSADEPSVTGNAVVGAPALAVTSGVLTVMSALILVFAIIPPVYRLLRGRRRFRALSSVEFFGEKLSEPEFPPLCTGSSGLTGNGHCRHTKTYTGFDGVSTPTSRCFQAQDNGWNSWENSCVPIGCTRSDLSSAVTVAAAAAAAVAAVKATDQRWQRACQDHSACLEDTHRMHHPSVCRQSSVHIVRNPKQIGTSTDGRKRRSAQLEHDNLLLETEDAILLDDVDQLYTTSQRHVQQSQSNGKYKKASRFRSRRISDDSMASYSVTAEEAGLLNQRCSRDTSDPPGLEENPPNRGSSNDSKKEFVGLVKLTPLERQLRRQLLETCFILSMLDSRHGNRQTRFFISVDATNDSIGFNVGSLKKIAAFCKLLDKLLFMSPDGNSGTVCWFLNPTSNFPASSKDAAAMEEDDDDDDVKMEEGLIKTEVCEKRSAAIGEGPVPNVIVLLTCTVGGAPQMFETDFENHTNREDLGTFALEAASSMNRVVGKEKWMLVDFWHVIHDTCHLTVYLDEPTPGQLLMPEETPQLSDNDEQRTTFWGDVPLQSSQADVFSASGKQNRSRSLLELFLCDHVLAEINYPKLRHLLVHMSFLGRLLKTETQSRVRGEQHSEIRPELIDLINVWLCLLLHWPFHTVWLTLFLEEHFSAMDEKVPPSVQQSSQVIAKSIGQGKEPNEEVDEDDAPAPITTGTHLSGLSPVKPVFPSDSLSMLYSRVLERCRILLAGLKSFTETEIIEEALASAILLHLAQDQNNGSRQYAIELAPALSASEMKARSASMSDLGGATLFPSKTNTSATAAAQVTLRLCELASRDQSSARLAGYLRTRPGANDSLRPRSTQCRIRPLKGAQGSVGVAPGDITIGDLLPVMCCSPFLNAQTRRWIRSFLSRKGFSFLRSQSNELKVVSIERPLQHDRGGLYSPRTNKRLQVRLQNGVPEKPLSELSVDEVCKLISEIVDLSFNRCLKWERKNSNCTDHENASISTQSGHLNPVYAPDSQCQKHPRPPLPQQKIQSIHDACEPLDLPGDLSQSESASSMLALCRQRVRVLNLSGAVLAVSNLIDLRKELDMSFGDWQLFHAVITHLRQLEEDQRIAKLNMQATLQNYQTEQNQRQHEHDAKFDTNILKWPKNALAELKRESVTEADGISDASIEGNEPLGTVTSVSLKNILTTKRSVVTARRQNDIVSHQHVPACPHFKDNLQRREPSGRFGSTVTGFTATAGQKTVTSERRHVCAHSTGDLANLGIHKDNDKIKEAKHSYLVNDSSEPKRFYSPSGNSISTPRYHTFADHVSDETATMVKTIFGQYMRATPLSTRLHDNTCLMNKTSLAQRYSSQCYSAAAANRVVKHGTAGRLRNKSESLNTLGSQLISTNTTSDANTRCHDASNWTSESILEVSQRTAPDCLGRPPSIIAPLSSTGIPKAYRPEEQQQPGKYWFATARSEPASQIQSQLHSRGTSPSLSTASDSSSAATGAQPNEEYAFGGASELSYSQADMDRSDLQSVSSSQFSLTGELVSSSISSSSAARSKSSSKGSVGSTAPLNDYENNQFRKRARHDTHSNNMKQL